MMPTEGKSSWRLGGLRAILVVVIFLFPCGRVQLGDGKARLAQTKAFLEGRLSVPDHLRITSEGPDPSILQASNGKWYSKFGLAVSILWLVPVGLAKLVSSVTGANFDVLAHFFTSYFNPIVTVGILWVMSRELRKTETKNERDGAERWVDQWAWIVVMLAGTMTLPMANTGFSEPLCGLFLLLAMVRSAERATMLWGAVWMGALATVKPELAVMPVFGVMVVWRFGWRETLKYCVVAGWGVAWILLTNWVFRGEPFRMSYGAESVRFQAPWAGLTGYFLALDRNIIVFNLGLVVAVPAWIFLPAESRWRPLRWPVLTMWVSLILLYASWWAWDGGWCFGPRFFVPLLPVTFLPVGELITRVWQTPWRGMAIAGLAALLLPGAVIAASGVSVRNTETRLLMMATHGSELTTQVRLLKMKVLGGPNRPERYRVQDFAPARAPNADEVIDFTNIPQLIWLNHWWAIYLAAKLQHISWSGEDI